MCCVPTVYHFVYVLYNYHSHYLCLNVLFKWIYTTDEIQCVCNLRSGVLLQKNQGSYVCPFMFVIIFHLRILFLYIILVK